MHYFDRTPKSTRTELEMQAGMLRQKLYELMEEIDTKCIALKKEFPTLQISMSLVPIEDNTIPQFERYKIIQISVRGKGGDVLLTDNARGFPSDKLRAQLMLIA